MNARLKSAAETREIESLAQFDELLAAGATSMRGWHFQSVDLRRRSEKLAGLKATGALFLGCTFAPGIEELLRTRGALLFPKLPGVPFNAYKAGLYSPQELFRGIAKNVYEETLDAAIYQWTRQPGLRRDLNATLSTAMHDHAVSDALDEFIDALAHTGSLVVGVMGGHAAARGTADYAQAAQLGRALALAGYTVATGGGPGAMEAANLGAYLSKYDAESLAWALASLAAVPSFRPSITDWARSAAAVLAKYPEGAANLGIPTWFYGHEPPNLLATHVAKYFANSIREAELLARCDGGIIFLPGAAGTIQEVFQDACENYYAAQGNVTPMILVGREYWEQELPVAPLLRRLAAGREMEPSVVVVDTAAEAVEALIRLHSS